jgi:hypothetical protein
MENLLIAYILIAFILIAYKPTKDNIIYGKASLMHMNVCSVRTSLFFIISTDRLICTIGNKMSIIEGKRNIDDGGKFNY